MFHRLRRSSCEIVDVDEHVHTNAVRFTIVSLTLIIIYRLTDKQNWMHPSFNLIFPFFNLLLDCKACSPIFLFHTGIHEDQDPGFFVNNGIKEGAARRL